MNELTQQERVIWEEVNRLHQKYTDKDLAHDAHGIWLLAGDFLKNLIIPFDIHPMACALADSVIRYYCQRWREENDIPEAG